MTAAKAMIQCLATRMYDSSFRPFKCKPSRGAKSGGPFDSSTKPQSGEKIKADILIFGAEGIAAPVGNRNSFSNLLKLMLVSSFGCCCRYTINSQCGTGKRASEGLCGEELHGFETVPKSASCASTVDLRL